MPSTEKEPDAMEAAVIAQLMQSGVSYAQAKAQVLGGDQPSAPAPQPEDDEPPVVPQKSKDFSDKQVELYNMLQNLDEDQKYEVHFTLPPHLMDWVIRKTLFEAWQRNNPNFLIEDFIILMLKEQRAIDPTKGGKVTGGSSGPKDLYNPISGKWG